MSGPTSNDDADSFSSDSDDEFLTMREEGKNVDREALIRKKLLESFYGKTSSANDDDDNSSGSSDNERKVSARRRGSHDTYDEFEEDDSDDGIRRRSYSGRRVDPRQQPIWIRPISMPQSTLKILCYTLECIPCWRRRKAWLAR